MIADDDHAVARKELGPLAVGREEGSFVALQAFRPMDRHAFARDQFGQVIGLSFDATGPVAIEFDEAPAGMLAAELGVRRQLPGALQLAALGETDGSAA